MEVGNKVIWDHPIYKEAIILKKHEHGLYMIGSEKITGPESWFVDLIHESELKLKENS